MTWIISRAMMKAYENSPCSQGLVEEYWEENYSDGERFAPLNVIVTPHPFWLRDKMTDILSHSRFGAMSRRLTDGIGEDVLTWFQVAFLVRTYQSPELEKELQGPDLDCGESLPESLAKYDRDTHSWRTRQLSLFEDLGESLEIWPSWGMAVNGECWVQTFAEPTIIEPDGGWLPTPTCADSKNAGGRQNQYDLSKHAQVTTGKRLNVHYSEWTMDWPIGWTDITPLETDKFQQWLELHGKS
jgi:hypothetical protein